jgi:Leucine-rich repeat (LRR) protein
MSSSRNAADKTSVYLRFNDSITDLPSFDVNSITQIDICFCKLASLTFLDSLTTQPNVVSFIVRHNKLQDASSLSRLNKLTLVHVDNNELTNVDFAQHLVRNSVVRSHLLTNFTEQHDLKTLSANSNQIKRLPATMSQTLEHLYALNNSIDLIDDTFFPSVPNLITFAVSGNRLTALPSNLAQSTTKLERLVLKDNELTSLDASVGRLTNLSVLDVRNNPRMVVLPDSVVDLRRNAKRLTEVPITMQQVTTRPPPSNFIFFFSKRRKNVSNR